MCLQWLVFRRDGSETAAAWAQKAAAATAANTSVGDGEFWDIFEPQRRLLRRQAFIRSILRQSIQASKLDHGLSASNVLVSSILICSGEECPKIVINAKLMHLDRIAAICCKVLIASVAGCCCR